jgi:diguanylate cyclase (GGDEF)-like protein
MNAQLDVVKGRVSLVSKRVNVGDLIKRLFDIVATSIGLIVLMPLFAILGILIKRDSAGPVFYRGPRIGKNGKLFQIIKFRTMHENAASYDGPRLTSSEDERITPLGSWLRNTKINELPQLWNVLLGDMSLVGPRPEDPELIGAYPENILQEVLSIRPGITSPASILYHGEQDMLATSDLMGTYLSEILPDKLRLDQLYVRNRSFISDLDIIFWSLAIFLPRLAKWRISEGYLFAGPLSRFIYRHFSWFLADVFIVLIAASIATLAWRLEGPLNWGLNSCFVLSLGFALVFSAVNYIAGLNRIVWSKARGDDAFGLLFSAGSVTLAALVLNYLQEANHWLPFPALPNVLILSIGLMAHFGFLTVRYRFRLLTWIAESWSALKKNTPGARERILIIGEGETCDIACWLLRQGVFRHIFSIVGIVTSEDPTKQGMQVNGCRIVGGIRDLQALVKQYDARMIVCTLSDAASHAREMVFAEINSSHIKLIFLDDLIRFVVQKKDKPGELHEYLDWIQRRAEFSPLRDPLTGLPNSLLLEERLQHSVAYSKRYHTTPALLHIDLNGSLDQSDQGSMDGQNARDELLKMWANRLMRFKRESDTLARFRAHEFALLLENVPNNVVAETILKRATALMAEPIAVGINAVPMKAKIKLHFPVDNMDALQERLPLDPSEEQSVRKPLVSNDMGKMVVSHHGQGTPTPRSKKQ